MPVLIPGALLEEIAERTRAAGENEIGGILLGNLLRDPASFELAVEITAQIPARSAEGSRSRLRFTAETWDDVTRAIELRRSDETWLGTYHSHPARAWCADCPPERRPGCPMQRGFFSDHDRLLHRVFPRAYSIALVATDAEDGVRHSLFGWRNGLIEPRGFHLSGPRPHMSLTEIPVSTCSGEPDACHDQNAV
jgi:proteasome lid subunit RPN8/RPN11